jgi:hypothetical protein
LSGYKAEKDPHDFEAYTEDETERLREVKLRLDFENNATPTKNFSCKFKENMSSHSSG